MELSEDFRNEYVTSLENYIFNGGETALSQAYELGRKSLESGKLILDTANLHSEELLRILNDVKKNNDKKNIISAANAFFSDAGLSYPPDPK